MAGQVKGRVNTISRDLRRPANRSRLIVAIGLALVVILAGVAALSGIFTSGTGNAQPQQSVTHQPTATPSDQPLLAVQEYSDDRGLVVNVPKDWKKSTGKTYIDFTDPAGGRKVRINIESASSTAQKFLQVAENGLKTSGNCSSPYHRVGLKAAPLAGRDGAELEYTCGSADAMRHGIWRAVVVGGKAYHFYLTVPDAQFADSKVIYDEMVRSFKLT
jgi:flagellar basal body-associated protein FliL